MGDGFGAILTGTRPPMLFSSKVVKVESEFATNEFAVMNFVAIKLPPTLMNERGDDSAKIWPAFLCDDVAVVVRRVGLERLAGKL
jgi:hypothetical protein